MELFTQQEINAMMVLINRLPMSPAEIMFVTGFFNRLNVYCNPPKPEAVEDEEIKSE